MQRVAGQMLQIFDLENRAKIKSCTLPDVKYWRWVSNRLIGLVTTKSVYHWSLHNDTLPVKIFDRHAELGEASQIISYQVSPDVKWCLLVGISAGESYNIVHGCMQLYSAEKMASQILQGHAGTFACIPINGRHDSAMVLCFESEKPCSAPQLYVMEIGRDKNAPGGVFRAEPKVIPKPADAIHDFPVVMIQSKKHNVLYHY